MVILHLIKLAFKINHHRERLTVPPESHGRCSWDTEGRDSRQEDHLALQASRWRLSWSRGGKYSWNTEVGGWSRERRGQTPERVVGGEGSGRGLTEMRRKGFCESHQVIQYFLFHR